MHINPFKLSIQDGFDKEAIQCLAFIRGQNFAAINFGDQYRRLTIELLQCFESVWGVKRGILD